MIRKILKIVLHPLFLPLVWFLYLGSFFGGIVRYLYISGSGEKSGLVKLFLSAGWRSSYIFAALFLITLFLWGIAYAKRKLKDRNKLYFVLVGTTSLATFVFSNVLLSMETKNYMNYLYSRYGLTSVNVKVLDEVSIFCLLFLGAFILFELKFLQNNKFLLSLGKLRLSRDMIFALPFLGILVWYSLLPFVNYRGYFYYVKFTYADELENYKATRDLEAATPTSANVILPVQSSEWPDISNPPITRYFLFPRMLVSSSYITNQVVADSLGDCYFITLKHKDVVNWPKLDINTRKISFMENVDLDYSTLTNVQNKDGMAIYKIKFKK